MSSAASRAFSSSGNKALKWVGATKADIINQNPGKNGAKVVKAIEALEADAEKKVSRPSMFSSRLGKSTFN